MFLRKSDSENNIYYVICANWESCVESKSPEEAAAQALEMAYTEYGEEMCLSTTVSVMDMSKIHETFDAVDNVHLFFAPEVLANAGLHELSRKLKVLINGSLGKKNEDM